jgi:hypothetical protein
MSQAGCYGPQCTYTGSATSSNAKPGLCTKTGGYIANAEIFEIINGRKREGRVSQNFYDSASASNILVYDDVEWVAWMDDNTKNTRKQIFKAQNMLGAAEWASDLQLYNPAPGRSTSWESYKKAIKEGSDPNQVTPPTGDWNNIRCDNPAIANLRDYTSDQRWSALRCSDAWDYAVQTWKNVDKPAGSFSFSQSISLTLHGPQQTNCGLTDGTCDAYKVCSDFEGIGAGAYEGELPQQVSCPHQLTYDVKSGILSCFSTGCTADTEVPWSAHRQLSSGTSFAESLSWVVLTNVQ